jgi:hypothetical protein
MTNRSYVIGGVALLTVAVSLIATTNVARARAARAPAVSAAFRHTGKPLVLVVLRLRDCANRIEGLHQLDRLAAGGAEVRGVVLDASEATRPLTAILEGSGIGFPVSGGSRNARLLLELSGYRTTPLLLVFNGAGELRTAMAMARNATLWSSAELRRAIEMTKDSGEAPAQQGEGQ